MQQLIEDERVHATDHPTPGICGEAYCHICVTRQVLLRQWCDLKWCNNTCQLVNI